MQEIPSPPDCFLSEPDSTYRLTPEMRAKVFPIFDASAVEELLQFTHPDLRHAVLAVFAGTGVQDIGFSFGLPDHPEVAAIMHRIFPGFDQIPDDVGSRPTA